MFFGEECFRILRSSNDSAMTIFGGDFNCVQKINDLENGVGFMTKKCPALDDLIRVGNFKDVYRSIYPRGEEFTFARRGKTKSRLDRVYIPLGLVGDLVSCSMVGTLSDHSAFHFSINMKIYKGKELICTGN